jgi:hypothetical protein
LVTWLLDTHGAKRVLDFLSTLTRPEAVAQTSDPEFVRASYRAHFGTELEHDIHAHIRDLEQLTPEELGCVAPVVAWQGDRIHLQADLDCSSDRVETDFRVSNRGFVDWTLVIPDAPTPQRYRLLDRLPADTVLKVTRCVCDLEDVGGERAAWDGDSNVGANIELEAGTYRLRWQGPVDDDIELDVEIEVYEVE